MAAAHLHNVKCVAYCVKVGEAGGDQSELLVSMGIGLAQEWVEAEVGNSL